MTPLALKFMLRFISKHVVIGLDLDYKDKPEIRMDDWRVKLKGIHLIKFRSLFLKSLLKDLSEFNLLD